MAGLPESNTYPEEIYQIETSDPVIGGYPDETTGAGMSNIPHLQLAKRTNWLKAQVDSLVEAVVAASTTVAGIVKLSTSTNSTSTSMAATPSAVKAVNDNAELRALKTTTLTAAGLATGGGDLSANRTITVPVATDAQSEAMLSNTVAMTPYGVAKAIAAAAKAVTISDWNSAITNGVFRGQDAANAPDTDWIIGTVVAHSDVWVTQVAYKFVLDAPANTQMWRRECNNSTWTAWYRVRISEAEQATLWAAIGRTVTGAGLATGGGDLSANRTITVTASTQAQAEAGTDNTTAMTPLRTLQSIAAQISGGAAQAGSAILSAITALSSTGLIARTASGTVAARTLTAGTGVTVTNGNGVSGNPTVALTIATQAEAEAGTIDTKALTPLKGKQLVTALIGSVATAAGFASSFGSNGYLKLPSWLGGLVFQWGTVTTNASATLTVTLPMAFPTACLSVQATVSAVTNAFANIQVLTTTNFGLNAFLHDGSRVSHEVSWIAVGY